MEGSLSLRKGAWCKEEDDLLKACVELYGEGKWHLVPSRAGLKRCRKSCRLRWLNYLKPNIKRGEFTQDEVDLIIRMHRLLGNRWSLIAGRIPGRTANDIKNYWNSKIVRNKKQNQSLLMGPTALKAGETSSTPHKVIKPQPRNFSKTFTPRIDSGGHNQDHQHQGLDCHENNIARSKHVTTTSVDVCAVASSSSKCIDDKDEWWGTVLKEKGSVQLENETCCFDEKDWELLFMDPTSCWNQEIEDLSWRGCDLLLDTNLWNS